MKYQRVLYTDKFTTELKSKLRIVSYDKRRSLKGNVYYVSFASDADMEYADRISKHLRNVTLKPFQSRSSSESQRENRSSICGHQESLASSSIPSSSSTIPLLSPATNLTFLPGYHSTFITSETSTLRWPGETLEERAMRVLGSCVATLENVAPTTALHASNLVSASPDVSLIKSHTSSYMKDKEQLIDNVQSCLRAMEAARRTTNELCQLHRRGLDCREALNHLFTKHSTAFYLKAATSAQIKAAFFAGVRLPWSAVANSINLLNTDIRYEQLFMAQVTTAEYISSKIDSATSIALSSKLVYQLVKLSN